MMKPAFFIVLSLSLVSCFSNDESDENDHPIDMDVSRNILKMDSKPKFNKAKMPIIIELKGVSTAKL